MPSSRDAFMDESHKKRNMRLYVVNSHYVQHLTSHSTTINATHSKMPLIEVNQIEQYESQGLVAHNIGQSNLRS